MANQTMKQYYANSDIELIKDCNCGEHETTIMTIEEFVVEITNLEHDDEEFSIEFDGETCGICEEPVEPLVLTREVMRQMLIDKYGLNEAEDMLESNWDEPMSNEQCIMRNISYEGEVL